MILFSFSFPFGQLRRAYKFWHIVKSYCSVFQIANRMSLSWGSNYVLHEKRLIDDSIVDKTSAAVDSTPEEYFMETETREPNRQLFIEERIDILENQVRQLLKEVRGAGV